MASAEDTVISLPPLKDMIPPDVDAVSCAGWTPSVRRRNTPHPSPFMVPLKHPKVMASTWRATKTHLLSCFNFNFGYVQCVDRRDGPKSFNMNNYMALRDGSRVPQKALVTKLCDSAPVIRTPISAPPSYNNYNGGYGANANQYQSSSTSHDVVLFGTLNDGTSLSIHVEGFIPWKVFRFRKAAFSRAQMDAQMKSAMASSPLLGQCRYEIKARASSDGITPSRTNPYTERRFLFIFVYNENSSYQSANKLISAMAEIGAELAEDSAMSDEIQFLQQTQMCATNWYTVSSWSEPKHGFITTSQLEIRCHISDIYRMLDHPEGICLAPQTEAYWDCEHHKYQDDEGNSALEAGSKRGFASQDDLNNTLFCINVTMCRHGAFSSASESDPCKQSMPRMDDLPAKLEEFIRVSEDNVVNLPDPLEVEQSKRIARAAATGAGGSTVDVTEIVADEDKLREDNAFGIQDPLEAFEDPHGGEAFDLEQLPELMAESNCAELLEQCLQARTVVGHGEEDEAVTANIMALASRIAAAGGDMSTTTVEWEPEGDRRGRSEINSSSQEEKSKLNEVQPEDAASMESRMGYEIPAWAVSKLRARVDMKNDRPKCKTASVLNNLKHVRRYCFFVDPALPVSHAKFLVPPLYKDESDGVLVFAFQEEGDSLLAFRDFMVSVHPDMTCGHNTRGYDWRLLFTRANLCFQDCHPVRNSSRDSPVPETKINANLPILEYKGMLSTKNDPFPIPELGKYYQKAETLAQMGPKANFMRDELSTDVRQRVEKGRIVSDRTNRKSAFSFQSNFIFDSVELFRAVKHSENAASVEAYFPSIAGSSDVDSVVAIRLADSTLESMKLEFLARKFLDDSKMDIGIPRMDACYRKKQYWVDIAYCDYDCILVMALITVLSIRLSHAAASNCSYLDMNAVPNYGQQRRIYCKNAVIAHQNEMVLVKSEVVCPPIFEGAHVELPRGGVIPTPVTCADFMSYYVTHMMEKNTCSTSYCLLFNDAFEPMRENYVQQTAAQALRNVRAFSRRLRKVYGPPTRRIRPGAKKYFVCQRCEVEDFSRVPPHIKSLEDIANLPSHDKVDEDPSLGEQFKKLTPAECPGCAKKPWLAALDPEYDASRAPDPSSPFDPFREERYAADFDYLVPRSSRVTFHSDPEAILMKDQRRKDPADPEKFVHESNLTEHESFDHISDDDWVSKRLAVNLPAFAAALKEKCKGLKGEKKKKLREANYIPSNANFVLWRPGDFDNQARKLYERSHPKQAALMEPDIAEVRMRATQKEMNAAWTVDSFKKYADGTAELADLERQKAFDARAAFDRGHYDIRHRRGILKLSSTSAIVEAAFRERKATTNLQKEMLKNKQWYSDEKGWICGVAKTVYEGLQAKQLGLKSYANSCFGALGSQTGAIRNTFVACAITFLSRTYIYFVSYVTVTRWCPPVSDYEQICKLRKEVLENADKYSGITLNYLKRFMLGAPWPTTPAAGRQVQLEPVQSAHLIKNHNTESLWTMAVVYGDTDSIFASQRGLVLGSHREKNFYLDLPRREMSIKIGKHLSAFITAHFRTCNLRWVTIDWEKMMYPFNLFDFVKKRYIGGHWLDAKKMFKPMVKSWGIKRDMPKIQREFNQAIIANLLTNMSGEAMDDLFAAKFEAMIAGKGVIQNLETDVLPFARSQSNNQSSYAGSCAHITANLRLGAAFPGYEHMLGDRIEFVICYNPDQPKIASRAWAVNHIRLMLEERDAAVQKGAPYPPLIDSLRIDLPYYVEQCKSTIRDIYSITKPTRDCWKDPSIYTQRHNVITQLVQSGHWPNLLLPNAPIEVHLKVLDESSQPAIHVMPSKDVIIAARKVQEASTTRNDGAGILSMLLGSRADDTRAALNVKMADMTVRQYIEKAVKAVASSIGGGGITKYFKHQPHNPAASSSSSTAPPTETLEASVALGPASMDTTPDSSNLDDIPENRGVKRPSETLATTLQKKTSSVPAKRPYQSQQSRGPKQKSSNNTQDITRFFGKPK